MGVGSVGKWMLAFAFCAFVQQGFSQKRKDVYVDKQGVMRWGDTKQEVYGFGVNYTAPFAHAYRSAGKLGVDLEKAIEQDVYHFARLGFDAFRVHVWDTEISDSLGNLLTNEHLRLFDFQLAKMKERGIKIFLTPIAFWNNGYPEKDDNTPGFAAKYGKDACLINPDAIKAQEKYLFQFLNHVNQYTGIAYKNDPDIVAFEISNEPHHRGKPEEVKAYINRMEASMRKTGCAKPIFYNVSHSVHLGDTYFKSNIDGGTFQWYPTGLGAHHELRGNFLPNVDRYTMPFDHLISFKSKAKIVYEFDAADVGRSYIYPAMARSFREAGIQWATHFAYDPTFLAYANTEYNTHYMNLLYAPQKALSLKIAGEVFHQVPRYKSFGRYPDNMKFDGFRVSYEEDLAEFLNEKKFYYTNSTSTQPSKPDLLEEVSGYGTSGIVKYEGKGAYFLDKIGKGIWRLEVYPDAIWVNNIFGRNSLDREVAVLKWNEWPMEVSLPDLGENFTIVGLRYEAFHATANGKQFSVKPGVYVLTNSSVRYKLNPTAKLRNFSLNEFGAEEKPLKNTYVIHQPLEQVLENKAVKVSAEVVIAGEPKQVQLFIGSGWGVRSFDMQKVSGYTYQVVLPAETIQPGFLSYHIAVTDANGVAITFPSGSSKTPADWDFGDVSSYTTAILPAGSSLYLFNAFTDADEVSREWRRGSAVQPVSPNVAAMVVAVPKLVVQDEENLNGKAVPDYSLRYNFTPNVKGRADELNTFRKIVIRGSVENSFPIQFAFIDRDGNTFGATLLLRPDQVQYSLDIEKLAPVKQVTLPRPYPSFLPYFFEPSKVGKLDLQKIETIQISVGPGMDQAEFDRGDSYKFMIESIRLTK